MPISNAEYAAKMSATQYKPWTGADVAVIEQFLNDFNAAKAHAPRIPQLDMSRFWGLNAEQMIAEAERLNKRHAKTAGKRAMVTKYGEETAREIIFKHSGRRIS